MTSFLRFRIKSIGSWLTIGEEMKSISTREVVDKVDDWWEQALPGLAKVFGPETYVVTVARQRGVAEGIISGLNENTGLFSN